MRRAYRAESALAAEAEPTGLAAELDRTHPGAPAWGPGRDGDDAASGRTTHPGPHAALEARVTLVCDAASSTEEVTSTDTIPALSAW